MSPGLEPDRAIDRWAGAAMKIHTAVIVLGAFLLFLIQPMMARVLLPWYGGSASVWAACILFFQGGLLAGYVYAHGLATRLAPRMQAVVHIGLLLASLLFVPVVVSESWKPESTENPVGPILFLLTSTVGLPYFLLSTTAPLLQHWIARTSPGRPPYRLYAASNLGALVGLLLYPFGIEPTFALATQSTLWSSGYGLYAGFCAIAAMRMLLPTTGGRRAASRTPSARSPRGVARLPWTDKLFWGALAASGATALLATTNQMCLNVAVVPFLLVLPLSLYLLSFVVCFEREAWYDRRLWMTAFVLGVAAVLWLLGQEEEPPFGVQLAVYCGSLFAGCMVCHGELVRMKPAPARLTTFYVMVAAGGAAGGALVSLLAPGVFPDYWEFPLALLATYALGGLSAMRESDRGLSRIDPRAPLLAWLAGGVLLVFMLGSHAHRELENVLAIRRNFYGMLRVYESGVGTEDWRRYLWHGPICHGSQFMDEGRRREPTMYYLSDAGISVAVERHPKRTGPQGGTRGGLRIGVLGLGTGTLAAYGRPGDVFRFYEINPDVVRFAQKYFSYLEDSKATVETVLGDGRLVLERELLETGSQGFDILAMDAFSGDAIPVHLLTREAFEIYRKHLCSGGILAVHVSNLHFDLRPVVRGLAEVLDLPAILIQSQGKPEEEIYATDWILLTENGEFLSDDIVAAALTPWTGSETAVWTDDYTNLLGVLKKR